MEILKPSEQVIVAATGVAIVVAIFAKDTPNNADVRADKTGNLNTFNSTKMAAITSVAVIGTIALLSKSPTVFVVGGATVIFEAWKQHAFNFGVNGTHQNLAASATY